MKQKLNFEKVFLEQKENVWKLVSKYVYKKEDKEDLFQDVFINIHKALPRFRGESALATWIYKITVNTAINFLKKQNRYSWLENAISNLRIIEPQKPPEDANESQVLSLLDSLNPQQRMIILLADVEEKKLDNIAELMKLPVGTVKSNLHRARKILRASLAKLGH